MKKTRDALQAVLDFVALQGRVVREFLLAYNPRDRERFFDVANGTMLVDGVPWTHRRHGAGVTFVGPGGVVVNAHVDMVDYPEAVDGGRIFEYLESLGVASVTVGDAEYDVTPENTNRLMRALTAVGFLRAVTTRGRFPHDVYCVADSADSGHGASN